MSKSNKELNPKLSQKVIELCVFIWMEKQVSSDGNHRNRIVEVETHLKLIVKLLTVDWDNGKHLSLLSITDKWIKIVSDNTYRRI
jgi:hypothetical protein